MFSVGIFTTHIPYIAMIAFYAYFMLFGVNKADNKNNKLTEKSITIEYHSTHFKQITLDKNHNFYVSADAVYQHFLSKNIQVKQKWDSVFLDKLTCQELPTNSLFNRPPPVLI